jgi:IBR domain, a half RING-finger domain
MRRRHRTRLTWLYMNARPTTSNAPRRLTRAPSPPPRSTRSGHSTKSRQSTKSKRSTDPGRQSQSQRSTQPRNSGLPSQSQGLTQPRKLMRTKVPSHTGHRVKSQDAEDAEITVALLESLTQRSIFDLPFDEWPVAEPTECIACLDTLAPSYFPRQRITPTCDHSTPDTAHRRICSTCLARHLEVQLEGSGPNRLTCPICFASLTHNNVKQLVSPQTFARFDRLLTRNTISSDPNFVWCSNPKCGAGQVHASGSTAPIVICHACGSRTCFNHHRTWHEGFTCHEIDNPEAVEERMRWENTNRQAMKRQQENQQRVAMQMQKDEAFARQIQVEESLKNSKQKQREEQEAARRLKKQQFEAEKQQQRAREVEARKQREAQEKERAAKARFAEQVRRQKEEKQGESEVLKTSKPCPGSGCSYRIFKIDGCRHMTCEFPYAERRTASNLGHPTRILTSIFKAHTVAMSGVGFVASLGETVI